MIFKVKEVRESKGITQEKLSELSGVSRSIISGLESGAISTTTTETLRKLASALSVRVGDLFLDQNV